MKLWEIIVDNLRKAGWSGAAAQRLIHRAMRGAFHLWD
jgi:hypothetical protein